MSPKSKQIYQIKVTLRDSSPPIWRRIQVRSDTRLDELHLILQDVMGWDNYHMHQFVIQGEYYGQPCDDDFMDMRNESKYKLSDLVSGEKFKFVYEYDFGDSWEHSLLVEKILPVEKGIQYPVCIKGKRACPPEDVGGVWGYASFLEAINDPKNPEHEEYLEWVGGEFDPEKFDLDEVNAALNSYR
ncbi:MAG: plasmid pRiA4b ORF-3 family protein [Chloroflexi bacterium]|nr:plasmid pRiA4b ORF-3 family protein [Chloroflexota bacterium]